GNLVSGGFHHQGPVWPGPGPQPPTWPAPPPVPKPERGPRPDDVKLSVQLWIFVILAAATSFVAQVFVMHDSDWLRQKYELMRESGGTETADGKQMTLEQYSSMMVTVGVVMAVVGVAVAAGLVVFLWRGQNWARVVLQLAAAFVLMQGVLGFFSGNAEIAVPAILAAVAVIGAMISANSREAMEYFKPGSTAASR
ncbi:hypothetical protein, partial [Tsukamurella paurometabola]|nr:hypothetical protein [Tsukamurella paurometabola]